jgi:hypothetical protein
MTLDSGEAVLSQSVNLKEIVKDGRQKPYESVGLALDSIVETFLVSNVLLLLDEANTCLETKGLHTDICL